MLANISFFNSLSASGGNRFVANSEVLAFLKEFAEKSTGAMLCQQWLDSIRDRSDVTADLTARLSDASHDYDKEKAKAASKLKDSLMANKMQLDEEDKAYLSSLDPNIGAQVDSLVKSAVQGWKRDMLSQVQQGAELEDLLGDNAQVSMQPSPMTPPAPAPAPVASEVPTEIPLAEPPRNDISSVEY